MFMSLGPLPRLSVGPERSAAIQVEAEINVDGAGSSGSIPLAPDDPIDPRRITCIHKESSLFRQRLEARRQIKRMMREASPLVQLARRFSKTRFLEVSAHSGPS